MSASRMLIRKRRPLGATAYRRLLHGEGAHANTGSCVEGVALDLASSSLSQGVDIVADLKVLHIGAANTHAL